jgi:FixJ family two-component response regulator
LFEKISELDMAVAHMKSDSELGEPTIHLVDDDPSVLRALSRLLRSADYHVEQFGSAEEFLLYLGSFRGAPGCAIIDLKLPGLNGLELQESLRRKKASLPVIFLTGQGVVPGSERAMKNHAVDFLMKPVSADDLLAAVQRALAADAATR